MSYELPSFDTLIALAKSDPDALCKIRKEASQDAILNAPENCKRRLEGLQFQIDMEVRRAKSPMDSCIRVSKMMHSSFSEMRSSLNMGLGRELPEDEVTYAEETETAKVLPFR